MTSIRLPSADQWPYLAIPAGITLLAAAILINFLLYRPDEERRIFQLSAVDTLSMSLFAAAASGLITLKWGYFQAGSLKGPLQILGVVLFYGAILTNLLGRRRLGANWSDQIRIRSAHTLVRTGIYGHIRHPLYASTIGMLLGAGLVYTNGPVLLLTVLVFIPMMVYRARQEEMQLLKTFPEYADYRCRTGMFLPHFTKRRLR